MKTMISAALLLAVGIVGCTQPKPPAPAPSTNNGKTASASFAEQVFMVPLRKAGEDAPTAVPWKQLFQKIANDHESQLLAKRLWWDASVEFIVAESADKVGAHAYTKEEAEELAAGPSVVRIRICSEASPTGSTDKLSVGLWTYRCLFHRVIAEGQTYKSMAEAMNLFGDSDDYEFLLLLCNDYLLRHDAGWIVVDGRGKSPDNFTSPELDATQAKADLGSRIEKYLTKYVQVKKP